MFLIELHRYKNQRNHVVYIDLFIDIDEKDI